MLFNSVINKTSDSRYTLKDFPVKTVKSCSTAECYCINNGVLLKCRVSYYCVYNPCMNLLLFIFTVKWWSVHSYCTFTQTHCILLWTATEINWAPVEQSQALYVFIYLFISVYIFIYLLTYLSIYFVYLLFIYLFTC